MQETDGGDETDGSRVPMAMSVGSRLVTVSRWVSAALLVGLCTFAVPVASAGGADGRQSAEYKLLAQQPGAASAASLSIDYVNPADPSAKPPAVRTVVEDLAAGARIDTSVPEQCGAGDAQLMLQGASACPSGSKVGKGTIRLDTGFPEPGRFIDADVVFLNNAGELIFVSTERSTGARVVTRSTVKGGQIVNAAPLLPGTPPDGAAIDVVQVQLDKISRQTSSGERAYITTPPECPPSGNWTNAATFTYADGVSQKVTTDSPCRQGSRTGRCSNRQSGGRGADRLRGGSEGDRILGRGGDDRLLGEAGDDCLRGQRGDDRLRGGAGADRLFGSEGADVLAGGPGRDHLFGGSGPDTVQARDGTRDVIRCGGGDDRVLDADRKDRLVSC